MRNEFVHKQEIDTFLLQEVTHTDFDMIRGYTVHLSFSLLLQWLQLLLVQLYISGSTFVVSLYINSRILTSFPLPFFTTVLSAGIATSISVHVFSFLFLIIISGLFAVTSLSVCTA